MYGRALRALVAMSALYSGQAFASSALEDKIADVVVWLVVLMVPIVGVTVFWFLHIWPERHEAVVDAEEKSDIMVRSVYIGITGAHI